MKSSSFKAKSFLKSLRLWMIFGLLFSCTATLANFALLFLSGWFLAAAATAGLGGIATQNLFNMFLPAAGVRFFATVRILTRYCERLITHETALRATAIIRTKTFQAMIPRSMMLTTSARSGDLLARFVNDTDYMGQYPLNVALPRQNALICSLIIIGIFAAFNQKSAFILCFSLAVGGVILPLILHFITHKKAENIALNTEKLKSDILENLQGMADILFCGAASNYIHHLEKRQKELNRQGLFYKIHEHLIRQLLALLSLTTLIIILIVSARAYQAHMLTNAEIPMLALGTLAAFEIISPLLEAQLTAVKVKKSERNLKEFCTSPIISPTQEKAQNIITNFDLILKNVTLTLQGQEICKNLNLELTQGAHIALTGASGAGKTSLIHLITRLRVQDSGEIFLGGHNLENFTPEALSHILGILPQKPHLFLGSLKRNFLIAAPQATEEEMWKALDNVYLREEVEHMPEKLDTFCGEAGTRLSGGQLKRFALAQLLLRRPSLLILDEPTENLPPAMGIEILKNILHTLPNATLLCITHRSEPLPLMDHIFELKNGSLTRKNKQREKD